MADGVADRHDTAPWSGRRDSNPRHTAWKAVALPAELLPRAGDVRRRRRRTTSDDDDTRSVEHRARDAQVQPLFRSGHSSVAARPCSRTSHAVLAASHSACAGAQVGGACFGTLRERCGNGRLATVGQRRAGPVQRRSSRTPSQDRSKGGVGFASAQRPPCRAYRWIRGGTPAVVVDGGTGRACAPQPGVGEHLGCVAAG